MAWPAAEGVDSPKILARASLYRRCFSSSSRCWRWRISSGVGWYFGASSSSSSTRTSFSIPVMGSFLRTDLGAGFRLRSLTAGLKGVARGGVLVATRKLTSFGASLGWGG